MIVQAGGGLLDQSNEHVVKETPRQLHSSTSRFSMISFSALDFLPLWHKYISQSQPHKCFVNSLLA
jgi:hypothetical protein